MLLWLAYVGLDVQLRCVPLVIQSVYALIDGLLSPSGNFPLRLFLSSLLYMLINLNQKC
jgi:hypothetical protein